MNPYFLVNSCQEKVMLTGLWNVCASEVNRRFNPPVFQTPFQSGRRWRLSGWKTVTHASHVSLSQQVLMGPRMTAPPFGKTENSRFQSGFTATVTLHAYLPFCFLTGVYCLTFTSTRRPFQLICFFRGIFWFFINDEHACFQLHIVGSVVSMGWPISAWSVGHSTLPRTSFRFTGLCKVTSVLYYFIYLFILVQDLFFHQRGLSQQLLGPLVTSVSLLGLLQISPYVM